jgi:hypothetical protein
MSVRKLVYQAFLERRRLAQLKSEEEKIKDAAKQIAELHLSKKENFEKEVEEILADHWG